MPNIRANGVSLFCQRLGKGPETVVFLHGLVMDNLSSWYFTMANRVAGFAETVMYDLRGHGRSERPMTGYSPADHVADLDGLLGALGIARPVHLVGNSFGGLIAVSYAVAHPGRVRSLVLVDGHVAAKGWKTSMVESLRLQGEARDQKVWENFQKWYGRHSERKTTHLAEKAEFLVYKTSLVADLQASAELSEADLAAIACPTLGLYGGASDVRHVGEYLASHMPRFTLRLFSGCAHSVLWDVLPEVREEIMEWLRVHQEGC